VRPFTGIKIQCTTAPKFHGINLFHSCFCRPRLLRLFYAITVHSPNPFLFQTFTLQSVGKFALPYEYLFFLLFRMIRPVKNTHSKLPLVLFSASLPYLALPKL